MITELADSPDADVAQLLGRHRPHQAGQGSGTGTAEGKTAGRGQQAAGKTTAQALTGEAKGEECCVEVGKKAEDHRMK